MGQDRAIMCRDCETGIHLSKTYFPTEWTDDLLKESFDSDPTQSNLQQMMVFMREHEGHNITLIDIHSPEWPCFDNNFQFQD